MFLTTTLRILLSTTTALVPFLAFSIPQAHGADQTYTTGTQNGVVATEDGDTISILGDASVETSATSKVIESVAEDVNVIINTTGHVRGLDVNSSAIAVDDLNSSFEKITITDGLLTTNNISGSTHDPSGTIRISGASAATEIEIGENGSVINAGRLPENSNVSNANYDAIYIGDILNRSATEYDITITNAGNISTRDNHQAQAIRHLNETGSTDSDLVVSNTGTISAGSSLRVAILHETINGTGDFIVTNSDDGVITGKVRTYSSGLLSVTNSDTARINGNIDTRVGDMTVTNTDTAHIEGAVYALASASLTVNNADSATLTGTITTESGDLNLNVSGGTITGNVTSHQGDVDANISGGSVLGNIKATGEMDIALTGGSVTGDVSSTSGNVIASLDGGTITGDVTSTSGTVDVTLADGAIEGDISAAGAVDLALTGGSVTGDVSSSSGNVIASLDGGTITGDVSSTSGTVDVTLADGTLEGDISGSGAVDVALTGGSVTGDVSSTSGNVIASLDGGTITGDLTSTTGTVDVTLADGTLEGDISGSGAVDVALTGGSLTGNVTSTSGTVDVTLADGTLEGDISGSGAVDVALTGGSVTGDVSSTSGTVDVTLADGTLEGDISGSGAVEVALTGGSVTGDVSSSSGTVDVTLANGTLEGDISGSGAVEVALTGGSITGDVSSSSGNVIASLDGGTITGDVTSTSGTVDVTLADGTLEGDISGSGAVEVALTGGSVTGDVSSSSDNVLIDLNGGDLTGNVTSTSGTVDVTLADGTLEGDISGSGAVDVALTGGSVTGDVSSTSGTVDVTLANGTLEGDISGSGAVEVALTGGSITGDVTSTTGGVDFALTDGSVRGNVSSTSGNMKVALDGGSLAGNIGSTSGEVDIVLRDADLTGNVDLGSNSRGALDLKSGSLTGNIVMGHENQITTFNGGAFEGTITGSEDGMGQVVVASGVNQTFSQRIGGGANDIDKFSVQSGATATLLSTELHTEQEAGEIALDVDGTLILNAATKRVVITNSPTGNGGDIDIDGTLSVIGSNGVVMRASSGNFEIDGAFSTLLTNSGTLTLGAPQDVFSIGANSNTILTAGNQIVTTSAATLGGGDTSTLLNLRRTADFDPTQTPLINASDDVITIDGPLSVAIDAGSLGFTYGDAITLIDSTVDAAADYATLIADETIKLEYGDDVFLRFVDNGSDIQDLKIIVDVKDTIDGVSDRTNEVLKNAVRASGDDPQARSAILALSADETDAAGMEMMSDTTGGAATTQAISGNMMTGFDLVSSRMLESRFSNQRGMSFDAPHHEPTYWLRGFGTTSDQEVRYGVQGYQTGAYGIMVGGDVMLENEMRVGVNASYGVTDVDTSGLGNHQAKIDTYRFGIYGGKEFDFYYIEGQASYAYNDINTSRDITFGGLNRSAFGDTDGHEFGARIGAGMPLMLDDEQTITPYTNFQYIHASVNEFTESGAGSLNVHTHSQDVEIAELAIGVRYDASFDLGDVMFKPQILAAASYDFIGEASQSTQEFIGGGATFVSAGADVAQFSMNYGVGVSWEAKDQSWEFSLNYDGKAKNDYVNHGARLEAKFRF